MVDIIILFFVARNLGTKVRVKCHDAFLYQVMLVVLWFSGEGVGAIVGSLCAAKICGPDGHLPLILACAAAGVIFGTTIVFSMADCLPDLRPDAADHGEYVEQAYFAHGCPRLDERFQGPTHG
jgi:hypothetical protein